MQKNLTANGGEGIAGYKAPAQPNVPVASPVTPPNQNGGLSDTQAQGIQQMNKNNLANGMTPLQSQDAIKADPNFARAQAQYNTPVTPPTQTETIKVDTTPTGTTTTKTTPTPDMGAIKANADQNRQREILGNLNE